VKRTTRALRLALRVERLRFVEGLRIEIEKRRKLRPLFVVSRDAREVELSEFLGRERAFFHRSLKIANRGRGEIEGGSAARDGSEEKGGQEETMEFHRWESRAPSKPPFRRADPA